MNEFKQIDEFYPTPPELMAKMLLKIDISKIKYILEPSAGKGNLLQFINIYYHIFQKKYGYLYNNSFQEMKNQNLTKEEEQSKLTVIALKKYFEFVKNYEDNSFYDNQDLDIDCVEINKNLKYILNGKNFRVVDSDFLKFETEKKYDLIIMNPPFSNGDQHLLKAISLQKRFGGQIVCLLNAETIKNPYSNIRKELLKQLENYDAEFEYVDNAFTNAERPTDAEVVIIKVNIPSPITNGSRILNELKQEEEIRLNITPEYQSLVTNNYIKAAVIQYKTEVQAGKRLIEEYNALKPLLSTTFQQDEKKDIPILRLECDKASSEYSYTNVNYNKYVEKVRYKYWYELLHNAAFIGNLTSNLKNEYYAKIKDLSHYDFSLSNIYQIKIDILKQMSRGVEDKILELFEKFTYEHSTECDKNVHYFNGWQTNKAFIINKKVIIPLMRTWDDIFHKFTYRYGLYEFLNDIEKTMAFLDVNKEENHCRDIAHWLNHYEKIQQTKNMTFDYFTINVYKKGTIHITFTNSELLKKLNIYGCQHKNWLPPSYCKKHYHEMTDEEKNVIDEFEGKDSYKNVMNNKENYLVETDNILKLTA